MTTYTSIRLYISSTASILPNGFYDVIGFYRAQVGDSTNPYHLDKDFNNPVIKTNGQYYYLTYRDADGFIPTMVEAGNSELHLLTGATSMPIYLSQRDDAHIISNYDKPLVNNITFDNIDNLYTAYRLLHVDVYENYAIERFDSIMDNNNIIDVVDADFILAAQNPDGINIIPPSGNVASLKDFELTFRDNITAADTSLLRKIALYDYNTQSVAVGVDVNSIVYNLGGKTVTFSLLAEITNPSQYFLYIPSGAFTYETGVLSKMAMFAYTIRSQQGGGDVWEFIYSPTQTKTLSKVTMTFVNVASIFSLRTIKTLTVTVGNNSTNYSVGDLAENFGNSIKIELPEPITASVSNVTCSITFAAESIQVQEGNWNQSPITLNIDVVTEDTTLPTDDNRYGISISPQEGEVYEVRYLNIMVKIAQGNYGVVDINDGHSLDEIVVHEGDTTDGAIVDQVDNVSIKNQYTDEEGNLVYEYDCVFRNHNKSASAYTIYIPNELFTITLSSSGGSETLYSGSYELKYTIKPEDPESGEEENPNGPTLNFGYKLLMIKGTPGSIARDVAFRRGDTILINRDKFALMATSPCLTVTRFDHDNGETVTSKGTLIPTSGDIMDITLRMTYYNSDNVEVSTTATLNYGIQLGTVVYTDMGGIFPMLRSSGYPNYMRLYYIFQYNGTELTHELELQFVPNYIYTKVKENPNWKINLRFDLYSGVQTDYQWGCMFLTHQYDCILNYKKEIPDPEDPEAEPTIETHYIAELVPTTKVRTGNLAGIYNEKFGANQPQGYGLYGENVYLTGNFYLNNGKSLMDISDDILLATGDINEIRDGLSNLDTSVKATIEALSLRQETFEHGLDASIKNYISTNKNAVLKIGLDYSIWSLGSAGITMVNPNATYDFDPITGNYTVNPGTVGDGDEYVALQGSKIQFSTYKKEWLGEEGAQEEYLEVMCTTTSPELWEYNTSIYEPYRRTGNTVTKVTFFVGYIKSIPETSYTITMDENTKEFLRYVSFSKSEIDTSHDFPSNGSNLTNIDNKEFYSFSNYYLDTNGVTNEDWKVNIDSENGLVEASSIYGSNPIYFVPRVVLAGMFKDGKFNADYIEAKDLVAVDTSEQIETDQPELDGEGNPKVDEDGNTVYIKRDKYKKNPRFKPYLKIDASNFPVLLNDGTDVPAKDANYVVVSGTSGKITAKGANISGTLIIGNNDTSDPDATQYLMLTDGVTDTEGKVTDPGLYLYKLEWDSVTQQSKEELAAQFNGVIDMDPTNSFTSLSTLVYGLSNSSDLGGHRTYYKHYSSRQENNWVEGSHGPQQDQPFNPAIEGDDWHGYDEGGETEVTGHWETWNHYECGYTLANGQSYFYDTRRVYTNENALGDIAVPAKNKVVLKFRKDCSFEVGVKASEDPYGNSRISGTISLVIIDLSTDRAINTIRSASIYSTDSTAWVTETVTTYEQSITLQNDTTDTKHYALAYYASISYSSYASNSYQDQYPFMQDSNFPSSVVVRWKANFSNLTVEKGQEGFLTRVFGNGLTIGYNYRNYFASYFKPNEQDPARNQMVLDFQAAGAGMKFSGGKINYFITNKAMPAYIPILKGTIYCTTIKNYLFYKFSGIAVVYSSLDAPTYANSTYSTFAMDHVPYYSNYYREGSNGFLGIGSYPTIDNRGKRFNCVASDEDDGGAKFPTTYSSSLDIFVVLITTGTVVICFGEKWNSLFSNEVFLSDLNLKVTLTGIGKTTSWGGPSSTKIVPYGSISPMMKPVLTNSDGFTSASGSPSLYRFDGENLGDATTVTYGDTPTSTPKICNAIQFDLADDNYFDNGAFNVCIEICPNNLISWESTS